MENSDARAWLDSHVNLEAGVGQPAAPGGRSSAPSLRRMARLLELLGSPHLELPTVHVTGTNGKTSVTRMCSALLESLGSRTGSYTSPHLERVNQRIALSGEVIPDDVFDDLLATVRTAEEHMEERPSYFEIITAAALRWFADEAVDVAVVEVGLGGTWDATNLVDGRVAVVTNVSVDHVEYLGPTREQIAEEKAGIVKPGSALVLGETDDDLAAVFLNRQAASVARRGVDFGVRASEMAHGGRLVDLYTPGAGYPGVFLPLHGAHQADNAAAALAAAEAFVGRPLDSEVVADAFAAVRSPGRLEVVGRNPLVLLDGAHNVAGAEALRAALAEEFAPAPRTVVVGLLRQKEPHEMLTALGVGDAALLICCRPPSPRALDPELVARAAADLGVPDDRVEVVDSVAEGLAAAMLGTLDSGQIVITGSLYVVGAARSLLVKG